MTTVEAMVNAIRYLQKVYVGKGEEERFVHVIDTLTKEIERRNHANTKRETT